MKDHVKRIKRELVHKGNILDIYEDTMELPNGKTEKWDLVSHRMRQSLRSGMTEKY